MFAEPWQERALALAVKLSEQGHFTWKEWAAALAEELKSAANRGEPDDCSRYYEHCLAALERLATAKVFPIRRQCSREKRTVRTPIGTRLMVRLSN
jgi:nitrile hydratase accessory protein